MELTRSLKPKFNKGQLIKYFAIALLFVAIILPLGFMMAQLGTVNVGKVISSKLFLSALLNSVTVTLCATAISMLFAFTIAFAMVRSNIKMTGIISVLITIPMLIPSIAHGMGLIVLFGENGLLTNLLHINGSIYGFLGIVIGSVMYSFPPAFLMFIDILMYEDQTVYSAADIMGIPKYRQLIDITLPYLAKPLISIFFATFTLVFTDYGVPMMVGGKFMTLPLYMYNEVIGQLQFGVGSIVAIVLLIPALLALIFDIFSKGNANNFTVKNERILPKNKIRDGVAYAICFGSVILVIAPIIVFSVMGFMTKYPSDPSFTFNHLKEAFNLGAGKYLLNSLLISLVVAQLGTLVSYTVAYMTTRTKSKVTNSVLHFMSLASLSVPGIVLGLAYSLMYKGTALTGTLVILIFVNIVHFFSSPYLMAYNVMNKVDKNYETVVKTLGISRMRFIGDILIPETLETILEMFSYLFVNSMITISAVAFLATALSNPLSLMINQFETQMLLECSAIVSLIILVINCALKFGVYVIRKIRRIKYA